MFKKLLSNRSGTPFSVIFSRAINYKFGGTKGVTLSAESEKRRLEGSRFAAFLVTVINIVTRDEDHCAKAYRLEIERGERWK